MKFKFFKALINSIKKVFEAIGLAAIVKIILSKSLDIWVIAAFGLSFVLTVTLESIKLYLDSLEE